MSTATGRPVNYARLYYYWRRHHERFVRYVNAMPRKLLCQECRGRGEFLIDAIENGRGPMHDCGWCEGTGFLTPWLRGQWLRFQKRPTYV